MTATPAERKALKAQAHGLNPVVMIGNDGLTDAVLREIDRALNNHELIKIRVLGDDRDARAQMLTQLCEALNATPVQHIGKILVIHRENPEKHVAAEVPVSKHPAQRVTKKNARQSGEPVDQRERSRRVDKLTSPPRRQPRQTATRSAGRRTKRSFQR